MLEEPVPWLWLGPVAFAALWLAIFAIVARWGGWIELAKAYPSLGSPSGNRFRMRSAQIRAGCNYNNCITFVSSQTGLHLSMPFVFSFHHAPVFLPWSDLRADEERSWLMPVVVLTASRCPNIPIKLSRKLARQLLAPVDSRLQQAPAAGFRS